MPEELITDTPAHPATVPYLRVLLFSPLPGTDPLSGDTSYTAALLQHPPLGVTYTTYAEALRHGSVRILGRSPRRGRRWGLEDPWVLALRLVELTTRRSGLMFREPTWFVKIRPGTFDVIHQHLFAVRQVGQRVPVMSSAGYPLTVLYAQRERWGGLHLAVAEWLEKAWARLVRVHIPWLHQVTPSIMSVYSAASENYLLEKGVRTGSTRIISTGLPELSVGKQSPPGKALLFIGRDFDMKGGPLVLAAFRLLLRSHPDATLTIVGSPPPAEQDLPAVRWLHGVDRDVLLAQVYPACDVLVAPTRSDCGAPYAVLEALQAGLAVLLSDLPWLDPRLAEPAVTRVPLDPHGICSALDLLLEGQRLQRAQQAARELWATHFSASQWGTQLRSAYVDAARTTTRGV